MIKVSLIAFLASVFNNELILINPIRGSVNSISTSNRNQMSGNQNQAFNSYGNYIDQDRNILVVSNFNNNNRNGNHYYKSN